MIISEPRITHINFDKLVKPETIYKYRTWSNNIHKTIITDQVVYMSSPMDFEDTKDCRSLKRYDLLSNDEIYDYYYQSSLKKFPEEPRQYHRLYARQWFKKSLMHHPKEVLKMQLEHLQEFADIFGVLSLTENPYSEKMWSKYSEEHQGICVGFDPKIMFPYLGSGGSVEYYDELPIIYPNDSFEVERYKQIFCKEKKWEFENEYRTTKTYEKLATKDDRMIKLPKECFKEIIFGCYVTDATIDEVINICKQQDISVNFKKVVSITKDESVEIQPIIP